MYLRDKIIRDNTTNFVPIVSSMSCFPSFPAKQPPGVCLPEYNGKRKRGQQNIVAIPLWEIGLNLEERKIYKQYRYCKEVK